MLQKPAVTTGCNPMLQAARKTGISEFGIPPEAFQVYMNLMEFRTSEMTRSECRSPKSILPNRFYTHYRLRRQKGLRIAL